MAQAGWQCAQCTFINSFSARRCDMCEGPRAGSEAEAASHSSKRSGARAPSELSTPSTWVSSNEWICGRCTLLNSALPVPLNCRACDKAPPPLAQRPLPEEDKPAPAPVQEEWEDAGAMVSMGDWGDAPDLNGWDDDASGAKAGGGQAAAPAPSASAAAVPREGEARSSNPDMPSEREIAALQSKLLHRDVSLLSQEDVATLLKYYVSDLSETLSICNDAALLLLLKFDWRRDRVQTEWLNPKVQSALSKELGLVAATTLPAEKDDDEVTCLVCSDTVPRGKARSLVCRHMFCEACFSGWVCAELEKGPQCLHARCPMHKCPLPLPPSLFLELLPDAKARRRYKMFIISNLLERSHEVHACPFAECSISAYSRSQSLVTVFCGCGNEWCFACRHEDHRPVSCRQAEEWEAKRSSEHSNVSWIKAHTKACPKCSVQIEKNQGCNHMTCSRCRHEFCWLCLGNWAGHSTCTRFTEPTEAKEARSELGRYIHYLERFENHIRAVKQGKRHRAQVVRRVIESMSAAGRPSRDVDFVENALNAVVQCHQVLAWTMVYAYLRGVDRNKKDAALFLQYQEDLALHTDHLNEMTERSPNLFDVKERLVSYTNLVTKFRDGVVNAIQLQTL